ncbi:uncharacterized protein LOC125472450 [Pyrus x bretschneideri]|uniref:uncharacterized protein LOC125472450 n=1 Tax=Pyrus x bretschneideri TaxID=225117 RepID=UPI00202F2B6C|nr:uncharacterized protein LOC125472450 [Pyrus x bretschneideri]
MTKRVCEEKKDFMPELKKLASRVLNSGDKAKASGKSPAPLSTALKCKIIESRVTPFCNRTVQKFQSLQKEESLKKLAKPNPPRRSLNLLQQCKAWSKQSNQSVEPKSTAKPKKSVSKNQAKDRVKGEQSVDVSSVIQEIFGRIRKLPRPDDDGDDLAMVSTFDDILKEERKSARIVRGEDERERLPLEQEEKQEERFRAAKKLKIKIKVSKIDVAFLIGDLIRFKILGF